MQPVLIIGALKPEDAINGLITVLFLLLLITLNYTVCPRVIFNHPDKENENCFGTEAGKEKKKNMAQKYLHTTGILGGEKGLNVESG